MLREQQYLLKMKPNRYLITLLIFGCTNKQPSIEKSQDIVIKKVADSAEAKQYYLYAAYLRKKFIANHPNDIEAIKALAKDLERTNDWQQSLYYLNKVHKLSPNDDNINLHMAHAYLHLGAWKQASKFYTNILEHGANASAYNGMGVILNAGKCFEEALTCFKLAKSMEPNNDNFTNNIALTYAFKKQTNKTREMLSDLALIHPDSVYQANLKQLKNKRLWNYIFGKQKRLGIHYSCKRPLI